MTPDSPADKAGLRAGDVIVSIDGRRVRNVQALRNIEGLLAIGSEVSVRHLRNGRERDTQVLMTENLDARISGMRLDQRLDGLMLIQVETRRRTGGVGIEEVRRNSPTWRAGLRPGDLIVAMNQQPVTNLREMRQKFPLDQDAPLMLEILRRGVAYRVMLEP
jgi:S1-C subfamily serine protease